MSQPNAVNEVITKNNNISKFFHGANILIIGSTGFIGKVLLEKLLRSCTTIENIYLLIKPKKGLEVQERLNILLKSPVFDKIRTNTPEYLEKIKIMRGDVALPNLGLSENDRNLIKEEVNIIFHAAAAVKLQEDLVKLVRINVFGTKQVLMLCKEVKNLKSFVYVSTAYSNPDKRVVKETIYDPPYDPEFIIKCIETLPHDVVKAMTDKLIGKLHNTYIFSKALAENIVLEYSADLPVAIVRPSLVNSSWKEPFSGWTDSVGAATALMMGFLLGIIKIIVLRNDLIAEIIPVDIVTNTLITSAWYTATFRPHSLTVFNCVSGGINEINRKHFFDLFIKYVREYPTKDIVSYPRFSFTTNKFYKIYSAAFHYTPSYLFDLYLYCANKTPKLVNLCKLFENVIVTGKFILLNDPKFDIAIFKTLIEAVKKAEDGQDFDIDMSIKNGFDWNSYLKDYVLGIRQYILKDDLSTLTYARTKMNRFYWASVALQVVILSLLLGLVLW